MKKAILQVADTGPLESLVIMLRSVGYDCYLPNESLRRQLRQIGCDTVLDIDSLVKGMGYERPMALPAAGPGDMSTADLYVDIKAHRCYGLIVRSWPNLKSKVLWYRINGGRPEHVIRKCKACEGYGQVGGMDASFNSPKCGHCNGTGVGEDCGDEVNPPCPILTPNQWYKVCCGCSNTGTEDGVSQCSICRGTGLNPRAYSCWPPFYRIDDYYSRRGRDRLCTTAGRPICLIHNLRGWGYQPLVDSFRRMGVSCYGAGSPDGLIDHSEVPLLLSQALCMVHLKSSDAPGYALYEALAAACPVVCTRRLIWKNRMEDLLIPNETCLVFDREGHQGLTDEDVRNCTREVEEHLQRLKDKTENLRIGLNGYTCLKEAIWSKTRQQDVDSLHQFMSHNFG